MRPALLALTVLFVTSRAYADDKKPARLDEVLAQAKKTGQPVIVDFFTTWCHPCKDFDAKILPDAAVQKALGEVIYVRYDAEDGGPGLEAADRYSISSYPSFLALDAEGKIRARFEGLPPDPAPFLAFIDKARGAMGESRLGDQVKAAPADPKTLLVAARWYAMRRRTKEALAFYDRAVKADKANALGIAADAAWESARLRRAAALRAETVKEAADYLQKYPGSARGAEALRLVALSGDLPAKQVKALFAARRKAVTKDRAALNDLAFVALAAGQLDEALAAATRESELDPKDPNALDTVAEAHHYRGEKDQALAVEDQALALVTDKHQHDSLTVNRARFAKDDLQPSQDVERERQHSEAYFDALESLGEGATPTSDQKDDPAQDPATKQAQAEFQAFFAAARKSYDAAATDCKDLAGSLVEAYVRVELPDEGGKPKRVVVLEPDASAKLKKCLETSLAANAFPKAPFFFKNRYTDAVTFKDGFGMTITGPK
jgi:thiol-disulfide isomerase/thioredoxin